nr:MAG TPA: hypothetical protein [Caudoviricetes sp.]
MQQTNIRTFSSKSQTHQRFYLHNPMGFAKNHCLQQTGLTPLNHPESDILSLRLNPAS